MVSSRAFMDDKENQERNTSHSPYTKILEVPISVSNFGPCYPSVRNPY
jgi:hypothetical protein